MRKLFRSRSQAGGLLARRLVAYAGRDDVIVLALPRGGVPPGYAVARALAAPLDVLLVRKLGLPGDPEYAICAIAADGQCLLNTRELRLLGLPMAQIDAEAARERDEIARRQAGYRAGRPAPPLRGKTVILVDDGMATGATMRVAVRVARQGAPARIVVAVPVAPHGACTAVGAGADELVCLHTPRPFVAVGRWYRDFAQVGDDEVTSLLQRAMQAHQAERHHAGADHAGR